MPQSSRTRPTISRTRLIVTVPSRKSEILRNKCSRSVDLDLGHDSIRSGNGRRWYYFDKVHDVASRRELSRLNRRCNRPRNFRARTSPSRDYPRLGKGNPPRNSCRQLALYQTTSLTQSYNSNQTDNGHFIRDDYERASASKYGETSNLRLRLHAPDPI
jgi:hypothetical protein